MSSGGGAFGRWSGHEGRVLMNGMGALLKETLREHLLCFPPSEQREAANPKEGLTGTQPTWHPDLGLPSF